MQNKGLIRFLAWAFALVCLFQLSFTVVTSSVQNKAKKNAENYIKSEQVQKFVADRTSNAGDAQVLLDSLRNRMAISSAFESSFLPCRSIFSRGLSSSAHSLTVR